MRREFADQERLAAVVRAGFGSSRRIDTVARLRGGTKKGVYRLTLDDRSTVVAYVWSPEENFWPAGRRTDVDPLDDPFSDASGIELFEAARTALSAAGVRTPEVVLLDRSRTWYPADVALVEDLPGPNLEQRLAAEPMTAARTVARLGEVLAAMHQQRETRLGKVGAVARLSDPAPEQRSPVRLVLDRALSDLAEAAGRDERIARDRDRLTGIAQQLAGTIAPRPTYGLIHGELGPDHVLVDGDGEPVLIDIEGTMFFDVEWEHVFLRMRFGEHYGLLHPADELDERRMRFYQLAQHLSLIAGPLRLLDGDFPDSAFMLEIAAHHTERALRM
ncbi:aminoglycoside phosphotransferase family protein [Plantactinospora sp. S1510]|uniref:Aminoglycoside phosphotransferase family protein n=1 Tax=Plantactinospora alkalitolerans TaxID=2789879 RepID=A0ABS0GVI1_9ACTN|nr:phosphotransferase [Plantactinospora alkalitolerans]MBF9130043.1 aminoglycoside phosphotransferase family protein [Plantactinospora alkalitolerans]MBF9130081.1 aminoglycoside phosphotransferase family protein [Plantactinospora alkalitolerans]